MGTWQNVSCAPQTIGGKVVVQSAPVSSAVDLDFTPVVEAAGAVSDAIKSIKPAVVNVNIDAVAEAIKSMPPAAVAVNVNLDKVAESIDLLSRDVISVASAIERIRLKADIPIDRLHVEMPRYWVWATILMPPVYGLIAWIAFRFS